MLFFSHTSCRAASAAGAPITKSSSVGGEICSLGRNDDDDDDKKRRSSFGAKMMGMVGLGKKSQSASQLNPEGQSQLNQWLLKPTRTNDGLDPMLSFLSSALTDRPMATGDQVDHSD